MKIDGENKEVQLVKEEEYDLLKERFERGFTDIKQLILDQFDEGFKVRVAIITGNQSIVDQDFEAQFSDTGKYHIELFRTNLSNADQITGYIQEEGFEDYDLLAFMRGGGTGLDVFDSDKLSQTVLDLRKPFITALGHQDDLVMLSKIADKNLATPSALGTYLQNIGREYDEKMSLIEGLKLEIEKRDQTLLKKEEELEVMTSDIRNQLNIRKSQLRNLRLWIVLLVFVIAGLLYLAYSLWS
ncbi:MAG: exodeoxyribonuclease VII large subunit [Bacteroidota bacterium]